MLRWTSLWPVPSPVPTLPPPLHAQAELSTARMIAKCGTQQKTARDCLPPNCPRDTWRHAPPGHQPAQASWSSTGKAHGVWWEGSCEPAGAKNISPPNARQRRHDHRPPPRCWLLAPRNGWDWVISDSIWNVKLLKCNKYSFSIINADFQFWEILNSGNGKSKSKSAIVNAESQVLRNT